MCVRIQLLLSPVPLCDNNYTGDNNRTIKTSFTNDNPLTSHLIILGSADFWVYDKFIDNCKLTY